ncbi:probable methyltransferase-like protein 15 homolog isoform X2 [Physella acuta]|nr:probable methyltransferase-like protein 15 homolog isoform X2 [Physella acuta]XP_059156469.1 probable methyltransferase-like protein 15 homolog isoform X2 [Physella acuta]XP_059156470.1 probable methyltransferase-like protein 15 homolog isoform X2 [Physella acuta]
MALRRVSAQVISQPLACTVFSSAFSGHVTSHTQADRGCGHVTSHTQGERGCGHVPVSGHIPVLVKEVLSVLEPKDNQVIVDMTFGAGGHARRLLELAPNARYFACDRDPLGYENAVKLSNEYRQVVPVMCKFSDVASHLQKAGIKPGMVDSFLFDLGVSSMQLDIADRGFSLSRDGPLDMRMGGHTEDEVTAADVVNTLDCKELSEVLKKYGEERKCREIAHAIVEARFAGGKLTRTTQLAQVVQNVFHSGVQRLDKLARPAHVATKTFQALRIFVNDELNQLHNGLELAGHFLRVGGHCAVISFHSLEDRIVKRHFHDVDLDERGNRSIHDHFRNAELSLDMGLVQQECLSKPWQPISRKVLEASDSECQRNPRARSAKLRAAIKC